MKGKKQTKNGIYKTVLRLPKALAQAIKDRAESQQRSLNSQIIYELDQKPESITA